MRVRKVDSARRLVYGEVYAPGMLDSDKEYMSAETIESAAHNFLRNMRTQQVDVNHNNLTADGVAVVESFIAREGDPDFIPGSWVACVHINNDDLWSAVEKGELNGFSLEALCKKRKSSVTLEIPPVLTGKTELVNDHDHEYYVSYDAKGNFLGGRTSEVDGHYHMIRGGTVTEQPLSKGLVQKEAHVHRFSHIELLGEIHEE